MSIAILSTLEQADFTIEQARTLTKVLEEDHQNLATKDDFKSIKKDIKSMEARMATKDDIRFLEARMATKEETQSIREDIKDIRGDIKSLESKMAGDIKSLESKMAGNIKSLEARMVGDIKSLEAKMDGNIKSLESKMVTKAELNKINNNMIKWIVTGMFFNIGVLYVLLKYFG